jgi:hypothetical protein
VCVSATGAVSAPQWTSNLRDVWHDASTGRDTSAEVLTMAKKRAVQTPVDEMPEPVAAPTPELAPEPAAVVESPTGPLVWIQDTRDEEPRPAPAAEVIGTGFHVRVNGATYHRIGQQPDGAWIYLMER